MGCAILLWIPADLLSDYVLLYEIALCFLLACSIMVGVCMYCGLVLIRINDVLEVHSTYF